MSTQLDMFAAVDVPPEPEPPIAIPCADEWTRTSQRLFVRWMAQSYSEGKYQESTRATMPGVLYKLGGIAAAW